MLRFTGNPLDRASARRADPAWLAAQAQAGLFLPFSGRAGRCWRRTGRLFLPWRAEWEGAATRLPGAGRHPAPVRGGRWAASRRWAAAFTEMRAAAFVLPARDCAIAGQAKALLDWHARHGFCPNCGTTTADARRRLSPRLSPAAAPSIFPRTDPVVIMLPLFEDQVPGRPQCALRGRALFRLCRFRRAGRDHGRSGAARTAGRSEPDGRRHPLSRAASPGRFRHR